MLHARPSPLMCASASVSCGTTTKPKARLSGDLASFLVCVRKFIWLHAFLFTYVCMWHTPIRTWATSEIRPSLRTQVHEDLPYARMCTFLKQDGVSNDPETFSYLMKTYESACTNTKASQIARQKRFLGNTDQLRSWSGLQFQARRCTWRTWACLKLQCLCARLRLGVAKTNSGC